MFLRGRKNDVKVISGLVSHQTGCFLWQVREAYSKALYDSVAKQYNVLKAAIDGKQGLEASTADISLSQPWI